MKGRRFPPPKKWFPKFPEKYIGDVSNIIIRSSWEKKFFDWCDLNPSVVKYASEEVVIPYRCATDNRVHSYYVDAFVMIQTADGTVAKFLVEIKPQAQVDKPKFPGRQTPRYLNEVATYMKNQSKWEAATRWAKDRGMQFMVLTEKHLGIK